jgi:hypothetical protein
MLEAHEKDCLEYCTRHLFPPCEEMQDCEIRQKAEGMNTEQKGLVQKIIDSIRM